MIGAAVKVMKIAMAETEEDVVGNPAAGNIYRKNQREIDFNVPPCSDAEQRDLEPARNSRNS